MRKDLMEIYRLLYKHFGPQHWWPGDSGFEMSVGAILTQNTNWKNVEKAISNLKKAGLLELNALSSVKEERLAVLIKPSGYFRLKAKRLKAFISFISGLNGGDWQEFLRKTPVKKAREILLSVYGIGPETADSILLYAANRPTFVIDKYTLRFGGRLGIFPVETSYETARSYFMDRIPRRVKLYNEYHALLVAVGKYFCKTKPACDGCPVSGTCPSFGDY